MAKAITKKKAGTRAPKASSKSVGRPEINASNALKARELPAFSTINNSKYAATAEADMEVQTMEENDGLKELFYNSLKGIYWSELHLVDALPKMAAAAGSPDLKEAVENHLQETQQQVERLEEVFTLLHRPVKARKCAAMEGLTIDGENNIETTDNGSVARDLGIIMAADQVEYHEIAAYNGLVKLAYALQMNDVIALLEENLEEEKASSRLLQELADNDPRINNDGNQD